MKTGTKILLISAGVLLPVAAVAGISYANKVADNISVEPNGFHLQTPVNNSLDIRFDFKITNNSDLPFIIKTANSDIYLDSQFLGKAILRGQVRVPAFSKVEFSVWGTFTADRVAAYLGTAIGSILGGAGAMNFSIRGNVGASLDYWLLRGITINKSLNENFTA